MSVEIQQFPEEIAQASIEKINRMPAKYKNFSCDTSSAARRYSITGDLLGNLLDLGLPHVRKNDQFHFYDSDLWSVGVDLGLRNVYTRSMKLWSESLSSAREDGHPHYSFSAKINCAQPGHAGPCDFTFNRDLQRLLGSRQVSAETVQFTGSPIAEFYDLTGAIAPLVQEAMRLQYYNIPSELASDMGFLNESSLADCLSATNWLIQMSAKYGIVAREAWGLFVSVPFSIPHSWLEVKVADSWRHADPFFLNSLAGWGVVDRREWPPTHSPQFAVLHLASGPFAPMIWHRDQPMKNWPRAMSTARRKTNLDSSRAAPKSEGPLRPDLFHSQGMAPLRTRPRPRFLRDRE